ncbi:uncharacterized protein A1O5_11624 [Cladophialophora psammophila CBS 110553]|uniref:3-oxoacyl-[acyl-carrier protein] reductase n=1 Tax=Cladophialophora psammophila CBS 110553 TaxID=1182543 RepID=W9W5P7_9EURO|nr:uncharacterized protein A1O5_11624 [Cladophialophora psammophila CBS 110553]EXJ63303.1 hypothetical protein A1O5_11624 [Cladophialophora psammophila CBS 110553]
MSDLLEGVALVSGAGSGIGRATSLAFVRHGIKQLALLDIDTAGMAATRKLIFELNDNVEVLEIQADLSNEKAIVDAVQKVTKTFGQINIAVNNVGIGGPICATSEMGVEDYRKVVDLDLIGLWIAQREEIRQMLRQEPRGQSPETRSRGVIVNLSSTYGHVAPSGTTPAPPYIACKHGVLGMTKMDANSYAKDGIRINAICPGFVNTPAFKAAVQQGVMQDELKKVPMGRFAEPSEIAEAISFLVSPMSSYMSGANLVVDG